MRWVGHQQSAPDERVLREVATNQLSTVSGRGLVVMSGSVEEDAYGLESARREHDSSGRNKLDATTTACRLHAEDRSLAVAFEPDGAATRQHRHLSSRLRPSPSVDGPRRGGTKLEHRRHHPTALQRQLLRSARTGPTVHVVAVRTDPGECLGRLVPRLEVGWIEVPTWGAHRRPSSEVNRLQRCVATTRPGGRPLVTRRDHLEAPQTGRATNSRCVAMVDIAVRVRVLIIDFDSWEGAELSGCTGTGLQDHDREATANQAQRDR